MSEIILNKFYKFLVESIPGCVVKYSSQASRYETIETKRNGDHYVSASLGTDTLLSYPELSDSVLEKSGFTVAEFELYKYNPLDVPKDKVNTVLKHARAEFLEKYEEKNNYYRMLNGLPDYESYDEIWFEDESIYEQYGLEPCPVHEIPHRYLKALEDRGMLEELKEYNPEAKYLDYLGNRRIDIVSARRADNYEMLYFPNLTDSYSFYRSFLTMYEECRQYFLTVVYNKFFSSKYSEYDGYIGFMIMTMCINRMIVSNFKVFVERDFYDEFSTQVFLNAYGVPYSSRFTLSQMKLIAKNLNILLRVKHTDMALLDVIDILGYHEFTLSKYYLVKQHLLDNDGNPIFKYKIDSETGEEVFDEEAMYQYHFSRVPVLADNVQEYLTDLTNRKSYLSVTTDDPYWIEDKELMDKIRDTKFNYIETKYMDLSIVYKMYAILFETVYLTRAILDKREDTSKVLVSLSKLGSLEIPIFDVMIFLISIVCKFYKVEPNILNTPSKVLHIAGFNYNADIDAIRKDIESHPNVYNQEILKYINNVVFTKPSDINNFYVQIKNLDRKLTQLITTASTLESYRAYRKLYDTLMYIDNNASLYSLPNGIVPEKFTEYLEFANPSLYDAYNKLETDDDISEMIGYVTTRLMNIFTSTKYLNHIQVMDTSLVDALVKLLRYFKSLTVDLRGIDIIVLFDSRLMNGAHFYHSMKMHDIHMSIDEFALKNVFWEYAKEIDETMYVSLENYSMDDLGREITDLYMAQKYKSKCKLDDMEESLLMSDTTGSPFDTLTGLTSSMKDFISSVSLEDKSRMISITHNTDRLFNLLKVYQVTSDNKIKQQICADIVQIMQYAIGHHSYTINTSDLSHMITKIPKILYNIQLKESFGKEEISTRMKENLSVEVNLPTMVDFIYNKEYSKFVEEFAIWISTELMTDNIGEISKCLREVGKDLCEKIHNSERISLNDTYRLIWEQ